MLAVTTIAFIILVFSLVRLAHRVKTLEKGLDDARGKMAAMDTKLPDFAGMPSPMPSIPRVSPPKVDSTPLPDIESTRSSSRAVADDAGAGSGKSASTEGRDTQVDSRPAGPSRRTESIASGSPPLLADVVRPSAARRIEKQIAENWTGIVGTAVLVLGIGFLGIYAALRVSEFYRFLMIVACALILGATFVLLRKRPQWSKLALWMRSASGGVFLFASLGAGSVRGLQWIRDPAQARIILLIGILANLGIALIGGRQVVASFHVMLSLLAIGVVPQNMTTLMTAAAVAGIGVALTYKEKWDFHLLSCVSAFFVYHAYWYLRIGGKDTLSEAQNIRSAAAVSAVCVLAAVVHYREIYGKKEFDTVPFLVHLINWTYFGLGILMHLVDDKWSTIPLLAGAAAAFGLARYARKLRIRWLYCLDTLVAQVIAVLAVLSLSRWGLGWDAVLTIVFLELLAFTRMAMSAHEEILFRSGIVGSQLAMAAVLVALFVTGDLDNAGACLKSCALAGLCALGALALHRSIWRQKNRLFILQDSILSLAGKEGAELSTTGFLAGLFLLVGGIHAHGITWLGVAVVGAGCGLLAVRNRLATNGLAAGAFLFVIGIHGVIWYELFSRPGQPAVEVLAKALPLFMLSSLAILWDNVPALPARVKWIGIYLTVANAAVLAYALFEPVSPLIPGVFWLLMSLAVLEIARGLGLRTKTDAPAASQAARFMLHSGYVLLALFLARHILVHLQSEESLGFFKIRLLIEVLALAVFLYWALAKPPSSQRSLLSWGILHPLFPELMILFGVLTVSVEVEKYWHPLAWAVVAGAAAMIGRAADLSLSRLRAYAVLFYWASVIQVAFLLGAYEKLGTRWFEKAWILGTAAILTQLTFLVLFLKRLSLENVHFPRALSKLSILGTRLNAGLNAALLYPWMVGVALFLRWTFAKALLTLLWTLECFTAFVISIVLKEKHFRYASLTGLGICIGRLIFYDLASATTLVKAVVFLGVGLLMLGMHILYNKYKGRLFDEVA